VREVEAAIDTLDAYKQALRAHDTPAATALTERMLAAGAEPITVLTDVIAAAQREVGTRWQRGEWTVAQEHAATAIAVSATKVVAAHIRGIPVTRGRVVVACAEQEWHTLPAMMIDCALRAHGWDTTLLGASTTPLRLNQHLHDLGPEAVAVSCSVLGALASTRRFVEAGTAAGVPVVVGGSAFGRDDLRALALGATAWAPDAHAAVAAVKSLPAVVPAAPPLPAGPAAEQAALELDHQRLLAALRERWSLIAEVASPGRQPPRAVLDVAGDVLHQALHAVAASLLTGDPRAVAQTSVWITDVLRSRGVGATAVRELGALLAATLRDYPLSRELVEHHFAQGPN
jgi:MerR family transcriptional regulator, light-induced transcriptional regulator